jgi:hypothetical protein
MFGKSEFRLRGHEEITNRDHICLLMFIAIIFIVWAANIKGLICRRP